ncbi:hypothetical protein BDQ17DRAFT_1337974, partial [Cyathus striatus]
FCCVNEADCWIGIVKFRASGQSGGGGIIVGCHCVWTWCGVVDHCEVHCVPHKPFLLFHITAQEWRGEDNDFLTVNTKKHLWQMFVQYPICIMDLVVVSFVGSMMWFSGQAAVSTEGGLMIIIAGLLLPAGTNMVILAGDHQFIRKGEKALKWEKSVAEGVMTPLELDFNCNGEY